MQLLQIMNSSTKPPLRIVLPDSGYVVQYRELNAKLLFKQNIVLYGESGSGKSVMANTILHVLHKLVCDIKIVAGTVMVDQTFPMFNYAPMYNVYDTLDFNKVKEWSLINSTKNALMIQLTMEPAMRRSSDIILRVITEHPKVFNRGDNPINELYYQTMNVVDILLRKIKKSTQLVKSGKFDEDGAMDQTKVTEYEKMIIKAYHNLFIKFVRKLNKNIKNHNKKKTPLVNINLFVENDSDVLPIYWAKANNTQLIVFNDVSTELESSKKEAVNELSKIFDVGRHSGFNVMLLVHSPGQIKSKAMRDKFKIKIFTESSSAHSYADKQTTGSLKKILKEAIDYILVPDESSSAINKTFYKIMVITGKIYFVRAHSKLCMARVGNKPQWDISDNIKTHTGKGEFDLLAN